MRFIWNTVFRLPRAATNMFSRSLLSLGVSFSLRNVARTSASTSSLPPLASLLPSRRLSRSPWRQKALDAELPELLEREAVTNLDTKPQWTVDPRTQASRPGSNWTYDKELFALAHRLGYDMTDLPSLQAALTHRSALTIRSKEEGRGKLGLEEQNSRLAFLGKALSQYFVTEHIMNVYPNMQGNALSDVSSFLLNDNALAKCADYVGITDLIRAQVRLSDPRKQKITVRAVLAVVACLHLDLGPPAARKFVHEFIISKMAGVDLHDVIKIQHPRFMLRAILSSQNLPPPESMILRETGRATHFPTFVVGVYSGERLLGEGCGTSLKRAEREACMAALHEHFCKQLASTSFPQDYDRECDITFFKQSGNDSRKEVIDERSSQ